MSFHVILCKLNPMTSAIFQTNFQKKRNDHSHHVYASENEGKMASRKFLEKKIMLNRNERKRTLKV